MALKNLIYSVTGNWELGNLSTDFWNSNFEACKLMDKKQILLITLHSEIISLTSAIME